MLPVSRPNARIRYRELLSSLIPLTRKLPALRQAAIMSGFAFGAFSAYWTTLVFFLEKPPYHYGAQMAGLLGLAGVAGALAAPAVGWLSDRGYPRLASGFALLIGMIAFGLLWTIGGTIAGLAISGIVLDLGTQANLVTNQTRIYRLIPKARNRISTVFMVTYFVGGALGTFLGGFAWSLWRWNGVCAFGASFFGAALWKRYYSPGLQRFLSEDPIGIGGGDTNIFAYVQNDPVNTIDPLGLSGGGGGGGGGGAGPNEITVRFPLKFPVFPG